MSKKNKKKNKFQDNLKNFENRSVDRNFMNAPVPSRHNLKAFSLTRVKK